VRLTIVSLDTCVNTLSAPTVALTANKEIVLSAGTFGTVALLQLSGIGDKADLLAAGVPTVVHNPSVGKNMSDHALLANIFNVNNTNSYDTMFRNPDLLNASLAQWNASKTGPLAGELTNNIGWLRLPGNASIFTTTADPAAGPKSPHYEMLFSVRFAHSIICQIIPIEDAESVGQSRCTSTCYRKLHEHHNCSDFPHLTQVVCLHSIKLSLTTTHI
jgi:choline dehydrogenase-like flavoprotein